MHLTKIDLEDTHQFSELFLDYIHDKEELRQFYGERPEVSAFESQIEQKQFSSENRKVLCGALQSQYEGYPLSDKVTESLELLSKSNTYTVTTGHQLNIFTGPLYFIYKIVSVINICKVLKSEYPDYNFVPVYWMASEDHDFDEISYFRLNGKKHRWQSAEKGAVGRFDPSGLKAMAESIPGIPDVFKNAYGRHAKLADAVRYYVNELFGEHGLISVDGDDHALKKLFSPIIEDDIFNNIPKGLVEKRSAELDALGYKSQIYPREINLFYLVDGLRSRIIKEGDRFRILDTDLTFSEAEMREMIASTPERFSPNVVLRPVYQECILPNLAYIGGPAEVIYWLQLKSAFDHYHLAFPIVMPRNFALIIPDHIHEKWERAKRTVNDLFMHKADLFNKVVAENASHELHLNGQMETILAQFDKIKSQAQAIDPTLAPHVEAQQVRTKKKLEAIEKKFIRAEKRHQSDRLGQIESVLDTLFPNGSPQERVDNFLNFYQADPSLIDQLISYFDPFDYRFNVLH